MVATLEVSHTEDGARPRPAGVSAISVRDPLRNRPFGLSGQGQYMDMYIHIPVGATRLAGNPYILQGAATAVERRTPIEGSYAAFPWGNMRDP